MKSKDFDKKIKSNLDKYNSPLDVDSFWASIEGEVEDINSNKEKKRRLPFFFFGLAVLVFGSVLLGLSFIGGIKKMYLLKTLLINKN